MCCWNKPINHSDLYRLQNTVELLPHTGGSTSNLRASKCTTTTTKKKFVQQKITKHCFQTPPLIQ